MSKAFTKESDGDDLDALDGDDGDTGIRVPVGSKNYITKLGFERLRGELQNFLNVERPKMVETVSWAASNGDRSENGDYIYGKRRLREIDRRIRFLTKRLDAAEVIVPENQKSETIVFGATVTVLDEDQKKKVYVIVGVDETEVAKGREVLKISWVSPIGSALLGKRVGDVAVIETPRGSLELEIVSVQYKAITA